jgi:hypothetical protein
MCGPSMTIEKPKLEHLHVNIPRYDMSVDVTDNRMDFNSCNDLALTSESLRNFVPCLRHICFCNKRVCFLVALTWITTCVPEEFTLRSHLSSL